MVTHNRCISRITAIRFFNKFALYEELRSLPFSRYYFQIENWKAIKTTIVKILSEIRLIKRRDMFKKKKKILITLKNLIFHVRSSLSYIYICVLILISTKLTLSKNKNINNFENTNSWVNLFRQHFPGIYFKLPRNIKSKDEFPFRTARRCRRVQMTGSPLYVKKCRARE